MQISITFNPSLSDKAASFKALADHGIFEGIGRLGQRAGEIINEALIAEAPKRTGRFAESIKYTQKAGQNGITFTWTAPDPLASFILNGTGAHEIVARGNGVLAFMGPEGMVFTRRVHHPGTKPNDFPMRAWRAKEQDVIDVFSQLGREVLASLK